MTFLDTYDISVSIEGISLDNNYPVDMSFSMKDSVHFILPQIKFILNDFSGLFQEYLMTVEGLSLDVGYGYIDNVIKNQYIIESDEVSKFSSMNTLSGDIIINGIHRFNEKQEIISKAHKSRISDIVKKIALKYPTFSKTIFNDTGSFNTWYQPMMMDIDFIEKILLPNSYSVNSQESPFFCFINNKNEFHFRNYHSMYSANPSETIKLVLPNMQDENLTNKIFDIKRFRTGQKVNFPMYHRKIYQLSNTDGSIIKDDVYITDNPSYSNKKLPIKNDTLITGYNMLPFKETEKGRQEAQSAQKINTERNSLFLERFLLTIPLNVGINAGDVVNLEFYLIDENRKDKRSLNFTDKYLVESSNHTWDGKNKRGFTELFLSRKYISTPASYVLREKLMRS